MLLWHAYIEWPTWSLSASPSPRRAYHTVHGTGYRRESELNREYSDTHAAICASCCCVQTLHAVVVAAAAAAKQQQQQQHVVSSKRTAVEQAICPPSRTKKLRQLADIQRPNINYEANGSAAAAATGVATHQAPAMRPFGPL